MKKMISVLVVAGMALSLMACGAQKEEEPSAEVSVAEREENTSQPAEQKKEEEAAESKLAIKYVGNSISWDPNQEHVTKLLKELTGYDVEFYILPAENADEKLSIDLASGTDYDVMRLGTSTFGKLVTQNALLPLDDLLAQYGPNILESTDPELLKTTTMDGKIYGIPSPASNSGVYWDIAVRMDILEELNLEIPEDAESFYQVLKTIKEKKGIIPLTASLGSGNTVIEQIASAFGISTYFREEDGKLVAMPEQQGIKEYLEYMKMLYDEGLLDNDLPVNKNENVIEKFTGGQAAMAVMTWGGETPMEKILPAMREYNPEAELKYMLPLKDKDGNRQIPLGQGVSMIASIPVTSTHPEDAIKYLNAILDEQNYSKLSIGEEGVHYTKEGDSYEPILPTFFNDYGNSWWLLPVSDYRKYRTYWEQVRIKKNMDVYDAYTQINVALPYGVVDPTSVMPVVNDKAKYQQKLRGLEGDYFNRVISGAEDLNQYEEFLKSWNLEGGLAMTEAVNKWYQEK